MIILLHSMIAHGHHAEISANQHVQQHQNADNFIDFILLGFHVDQGDGHLKDMTSGDSLDVNHDDLISCIAIAAVHFNLVQFNSNKEFVIEKNWLLPDSILTSSISLRGPPAQS